MDGSISLEYVSKVHAYLQEKSGSQGIQMGCYASCRTASSPLLTAF
jgi:hypothetical protein